MSAQTFFLIAGEASGDILGVRLMQALRAKLNGDVRFVGVGGPMMQAEGIELLFPHTELMHFGIIEVLRHIPRLLMRIRQCADAVIETHPTALITIDSPDFCFRVAKSVRKRTKRTGPDKIHLIHYVAPTVWAWRPGRAKKIARFLDHLLAVLPFEPPYFTREGLDCTFVGHSVVEGDAASGNAAAFRSAHDLGPKIPLVTVLPGSRTGEITRLLPIFREAMQKVREKNPLVQIVVPTVPHLKAAVSAEVATWGIPVHIVEGEKNKFDAFAASKVALACSGTVALELALAKLPSVIAYKVSNLTALLLRHFIHAPFANLINIMQKKEVVPEFLQEKCTAENLAKAVDMFLNDVAERREQIARLTATARWLGQGEFIPSQRAAETILKVVSGKDIIPAVLQVLPALVTGGVERGTVEVTAALVKQGFCALVASSGGPMVPEIEAVGGTHILLPLASKNPLTMYANIGCLRRVIEENNVSVVHARSRAPAWSAYQAARQTETPFVTTFHSAYGAGSKLKRFYNSVMAKGARVIAISEFVADYAIQTYRVAKDSLRVVPRGVDLDAFDPQKVEPARIEALRDQWNAKDAVPVILMPGRLTRWKGQLVLLRALAQLKHRDFLCIIVGGGKDSPYGQELAQAVDDLGLQKNVSIFDTCRDMAAAYCLASVVVVPSTRPEGFGRVVVEAQAMGAPVIAANHGGARETVRTGETGWLVPPNDETALAKAIDTVLTLSPGERVAFAARAVNHIRAHFTTDLMTSKTLAVYRELLHIR